MDLSDLLSDKDSVLSAPISPNTIMDEAAGIIDKNNIINAEKAAFAIANV